MILSSKSLHKWHYPTFRPYQIQPNKNSTKLFNHNISRNQIIIKTILSIDSSLPGIATETEFDLVLVSTIPKQGTPKDIPSLQAE